MEQEAEESAGQSEARSVEQSLFRASFGGQKITKNLLWFVVPYGYCFVIFFNNYFKLNMGFSFVLYLYIIVFNLFF